MDKYGAMDIDRVVGAEIRAARSRKGWSQSKLADRTGLSFSTIRRYESGERSIDMTSLGHLFDALGIDMVDLDRALKASMGD